MAKDVDEAHLLWHVSNALRELVLYYPSPEGTRLVRSTAKEAITLFRAQADALERTESGRKNYCPWHWMRAAADDIEKRLAVLDDKLNRSCGPVEP